jgi:predicted nucleotidyltransferase
MAKIKTADELIRDNLLVKHYAGSIAYGTNLPTSDTDFRGIFCADPINVRTPFYTINQKEDQAEEDTVIYELAQFMKLALDCNPNVIETLWVDERDVVFSTPAYELLRAAAPKLLSSKIAFTTSGYALSQLKRIKGHNKWINNPQPEARPQQVDYMSLVHNFTGAKTFKVRLRDLYENHRLVPFSGDTFGVFSAPGYSPYNLETGSLNSDYEGDSHELGTPKFIVKFNRSVYDADKDMWSNYWTWKKNRNEKRSELEEKYGYDTKHAMHLVRLLRMGAEALETGILHVRRPDAAELLAIRNGSWSYEDIVEYAERMDKRVREELYVATKLPKKPDIHYAAELVMRVQDSVWNG